MKRPNRWSAYKIMRSCSNRWPGVAYQRIRPDVLNRWLRRKGHKAGQLVNAHSTRVYGYTTRAAARDGYISDSPGRSGNISVAGIYDFLAAVGEKDGPAEVERPVYPSKLSKLRLAGPVPRP